MRTLVLLALLFLRAGLIQSDDVTWNNYVNLLNSFEEASSVVNNVTRPGIPPIPVNPDCRKPYKTSLKIDCSDTNPSPKVPTSAHRVRPADIKVVGALGDSITAANGAGACALPGVAIEFRGRSWSIGGDSELESITNRVVTIPNILKEFNKDVIGYSLGTGDENSEDANFNCAVPGARAEHMPIQARRLIDKMKHSPDVDFENDWKLVTLFIGGNDICQYCENPNKFDPHQYVAYIDEALTILQAELPRTIVNVVTVLNVPQIEILSSAKCDALHLVVCKCAMFLPNNTAAHLQEITAYYQDWTIELVESGKFDTKEDFTAVSQPFFTKTDTPLLPDGEPDFSYFAPDCFHFSSKGHTASAGELWNNMMMPVGEKRTAWQPFSDLICPTKERPYIFTNVNSRGDFDVTEPPSSSTSVEITQPSHAHIATGAVTSIMLLLSVIFLINF